MHCYTNVKYTTHFATPAVAVACKDTMPELSFSVWVFLVLKKGDFSIKVTNYGATCIVLRVLSVVLPDKNGLFVTFYIKLMDCYVCNVDQSIYIDL